MRVLMAAALLLAGCAGARTNTHLMSCADIPIKTYPPAYQVKLAAEMGTAARSDVWPQAIADYRTLRAAVRACARNS